jgi:hypothetical protein
LLKGIEEQRQAPYKKLAEKAGFLQTAKENAAKNVKAQKEVEATDPNSATTKRNAAMLYGAYGIKVPNGFTAEQTADYVAASKLQGEEKDKVLQRLRDEARDKEAARHNRAEEGQQRYATDASLEREKIAKAAAGQKPLNEQEVVKLVNQGQAIPAIDQLERLQKDVGPSGLLAPLGIHVGAEGRYHDASQNLAGAVAAGALPAARETPALMEEFKKGFPSGLTGSGRAHAAYEALRGTVQSNRDAQLAALEAAGGNPAQVAALRAQTGAAAKPATVSAAAHPQAGKALAWARANKDKPEAQEILQRLGGG